MDPDLFRRAQERLKAKRKTFPARAPGSRYIFSGKLRCGECGYAYVGRRYCGGRVQGYICSNYVGGGKTACRIGSVKEEEMEKAVAELMSMKLQELVASGALRCGRRGPGPAATARRSRINDQVRHLDARLERLLRCITPLSKHPVSERMLAAVAEKERLLRVPEEPAKVRDPTWSATDRELLRRFSAGFQRQWVEAKVENKQRIVSALVDRIEIHARERRLRLWWSDSCLRSDESDAQADNDDDSGKESRQQNIGQGSCIDLSLPGAFKRQGTRRSRS